MGKEFLALHEVTVGTSVKVSEILSDGSIKRRLMDMGIIKGTEIKVEGKAPMGDPIEIALRGYKLTLRKNEAQNIKVKKI